MRFLPHTQPPVCTLQSASPAPLHMPSTAASPSAPLHMLSHCQALLIQAAEQALHQHDRYARPLCLVLLQHS